MQTKHRVAMWSGPRNISTAMMRSWGNRSDTIVHDEPFYAHYLLKTGYNHPGAEEVIDFHETDWRKVVQTLTRPLPHGKSIYYQKHMTHHMLEGMDKAWMLQMSNCFLIREPQAVIVSLAKVLPNPGIDQTGLPHQVELFRYVRDNTGKIPPVFDAKDILMNPRETLSQICDALDVPFDEAMLNWPAGRRATDGIWAKHWYRAVEQSTGFMPYTPQNDPVPEHLQDLLDECSALYGELAAHVVH